MWQRLFSRNRTKRLSGTGKFGWNIVGESHFQDSLLQIAGPKTAEGVCHHCMAVLERDPNNVYDKNAIAVFIDGKKVGYVSKHRCTQVSRLMGSDTACVAAMITGGWTSADSKAGHFGVKLDIAT